MIFDLTRGNVDWLAADGKIGAIYVESGRGKFLVSHNVFIRIVDAQ
jgi:hypothetical protein